MRQVSQVSHCVITRHRVTRHGGDDAQDDEPPGVGAEHAECGGQGGRPQPGGEAGAGARQQGGDAARREGEEAEIPQGQGGQTLV